MSVDYIVKTEDKGWKTIHYLGLNHITVYN